jgi:outer membrane protein TolC
MNSLITSLKTPAWSAVVLCASVIFINLAAPLPAQNSSRLSANNTNNVYPIDLTATLRLAGAQNLDIQIARERINEAQAHRDSAVEKFFPWLSPSAGYQRHDNRIQAVDGLIFDADKQSYTVGGGITAQVQLGDAIYTSLAARQLVRAANHAFDSQQQDSILSAVQGYYDLVKAKAIVGVVREAVNVSQDYQNQLHDAVAAGIAFKGDELRVQVQTERYQIALRQSQEQQRVAAARLAETLHLDSTVELVPLDSDLAPLTLIEPGFSLMDLNNRALTARPELKQSRALTSAANDDKNNAVYGPLIPSLNAQAYGGGLGGGTNGSTGNFGNTEDYSIGVVWRIGPGGLFDFGRIRESKARLEIARLNENKAQDQVTREVVESQTRAESLRDQLKIAETNLATAAETLRLTSERKQFGVGVVLENIQAQQELTRARADYAASIAEYNKAQYGLSRAIGALMDLSATGMSPMSSRRQTP